MAKRKGDWIQTYTGRKFWPLDPRPEDVDIHDIAHALSNMCRYTGHCSEFYSVAQHSVYVSENCDDPLWGLLHDASEAYFADIARPVKMYIPDIKTIENNLMLAVAQHFGLPWPEPRNVKLVDTRILLDEKTALMPGEFRWDCGVEPLGIKISSLPPAAAKMVFLNRYVDLITELGVNHGYAVYNRVER